MPPCPAPCGVAAVEGAQLGLEPFTGLLHPRKELGLGPVAVNFVYVLCPLLVSAMGIVAQRVGMRLGVAQTVFLFRSVGIALLVVLSSLRGVCVKATNAEDAVFSSRVLVPPQRPRRPLLVVVSDAQRAHAAHADACGTLYGCMPSLRERRVSPTWSELPCHPSRVMPEGAFI